MVSSSILLSVLTCSRNPNPAYFHRVLQALQAQSLPLRSWELLLIDNASQPPLASRYDLSWHPHAVHWQEPNPGKNNALLLGFAKSCAPVAVIVDDDNVLAPDYLERALEIASKNPGLGAWGGQVELEFEQPPPEWTRQYWPFLAEQKVASDSMIVSNELNGPMPVGAGCCIRREVLNLYAEQVKKSDWRRALGRCEDTDLALTACDLGLSRGLFASLRLTHLIPPERLTEENILRLAELIQFSSYVMEMNRAPAKIPPPLNWWWHLKFVCDCAAKFGRKRRFYLAGKRAQKRARQLYESGLKP